jgi:signal transduction histidine kinase
VNSWVASDRGSAIARGTLGLARLATPAGPRARRTLLLAAALVLGAFSSAQEVEPDGAGVRVLRKATFTKTVRGDEGDEAPGERLTPWQSRVLPDLWRTHGEADSGYGWYRVTLELDTLPRIPWALYVDFAHSSYSIRLNGVEVATDIDFDAPTLKPRSSQPLLATFSNALLQPGTNLIDVRLRVEQDIHGGLSELAVGPREPLLSRYEEARFWRAGLPGALNLATLVAGGFMLLLWLRRPNESIYPWFSALAAVWALQGSYIAGDDHWLRALHARIGVASNDLFLGSTLLLGSALLLIVVNRFAHRRQPVFEYGGVVFGLFTILLVAPMGRLGVEPLDAPWHVIAAFLALLATRSVVVMTLKVPRWESALIATGLAFLLGMALHDALVAVDVIAYTPMRWLVFGPPVMLAAFVLAMGGRWFEAFDEAERLNLQLERRVADRAHDIERQYAEITMLQRRNAIAEERERLMRDMHDGVGSQLMSTLNALERGQLPAAQVGELLRQCIEDLRLVIDSLDAGEHSLAAALANLRYRLEPRLAAAGLALGWTVEAEAGERLAPGEVLHVLRVVQEALTNAVKHARASRLELRVQDDRATGMLCVEVMDDGIGARPAAPASASGEGRGLHNMRERARSLRGDLEVSRLERGTCVRLRIPSVSKPEPDAELLPD